MKQEARDRDDAAARWMARFAAGDMTPDEVRAFEAWRADPHHAAAFDAYARLDASLEAADAAILAAAFERELVEAAAAERPAPRAPRRMALGAIAASLAVCLGAGALWFANAPGAPATYATARGQTLAVALADGSDVALNTASRIDVRYSRRERTLDLSGEALFEVARNPDRPFVVKTPQAEIVVLGTTFNVDASRGRTVVSVVSGLVEVRGADGRSVRIGAGRGVTVDGAGGIGEPGLFEAADAVGWRDGIERFDGAPLGEVVAELNRYFTRPLVLGDGTLADLPVTGAFDVKDPGAAAEALAIAFSLEARVEPSRVVLAIPEE